MKKGKIYVSTPSENFPEWYWKSGLHDACIKKAEAFEFSFDYSKKGEKQYRNMLSFKINANYALFDNTVKEIRFYNYMIISKEILPENIEKMWWMSDSLTQKDGKYFLEINMVDSTEDFTFQIKFETAEVDRA